MERETGFEPATSTLARSHSTTELFPLAPRLQKLAYHAKRVPSSETRSPKKHDVVDRSSRRRECIDHNFDTSPAPAHEHADDVESTGGL